MSAVEQNALEKGTSASCAGGGEESGPERTGR